MRIINIGTVLYPNNYDEMVSMLKQSFLALFEFSDLGLPGSDRLTAKMARRNMGSLWLHNTTRAETMMPQQPRAECGCTLCPVC